MLKQILCALLFIGSIAGFAQGSLLLNQDFKEGLKYWCDKKKIELPTNKLGFKVENIEGENCLAAIGCTDVKEQPGKQLRQTIKNLKLPLNHSVTFKMSINPVKISGTLNFMIREVNAKGKTIRYRKILLNKWAEPGWKEYSQSFVAMPPTVYLQVFIQSMYFQPGDKVLMKDFKLEVNKR